MQNVADDRAGWRSDDSDHVGKERQKLLARLIEQSFGGKLPFAFFQKFHQRADTGGLQAVDDNLILRACRKCRQPARDDNFKSLLWLDAHAAISGSPDHGLDAGVLILESEIGMARRMWTLEAGNFPANAHIAVSILDGAPERSRKLRDGPFHNVIERRLCHMGRISCGHNVPCYTKPQPSTKDQPRGS